MSVKLLIVDDEAGIRTLYSAELRREGYAVETASSSIQADEVLSRDKIDLVILDIEMPEIDGLEMVAKIRVHSPDTRLILNSAYAVYKADFKSWLADAYLVKSSDLSKLKLKIKELVGPCEYAQ